MRNSKKVDFLKVYLSWCKELREIPVPEASMLTDEALEKKIEEILKKHNEFPFITEEK